MILKDSIFLHGLRVAYMSDKLCKVLSLNAKTRLYIFIGAFFHDIGKLKINRKILNKPNKLSADEFEEMKKHVNVKNSLINNITINNIISYHHENVDGTGYKGLTSIPLEAKIVRICDVFDALTHDRIYHKKISSNYAIMVMENEISYYDLNVFNKFKKLILKGERYNKNLSKLKNYNESGDIY